MIKLFLVCGSETSPLFGCKNTDEKSFVYIYKIDTGHLCSFLLKVNNSFYEHVATVEVLHQKDHVEDLCDFACDALSKYGYCTRNRDGKYLWNEPKESLLTKLKKYFLRKKA